ncbi:MAG: ABC transporter ATP-binding protein [Anaerolineae bacterium]|nr:ABC transporter ATP-binding protein [Anaerolineae bacterium]
MLEIKNLQAGYGLLQILWDVSLEVREGEFVALIGSNGAGKTSTLRSVAGFLKPWAGTISFTGHPLNALRAHQISRLGVSFVTEELNLFEKMTVWENLLLGAYTRRDRKKVRATLDQVLALFPLFEGRRNQAAGTLSGGERKMLALGRGLMAAPRLLLVDEPSLGLAPVLAQEVYRALGALHKQGVTILLVEQNVNATLKITDRSYVMEQGRIVMEGASATLREDRYLKETYLGLANVAVHPTPLAQPRAAS